MLFPANLLTSTENILADCEFSAGCYLFYGSN